MTYCMDDVKNSVFTLKCEHFPTNNLVRLILLLVLSYILITATPLEASRGTGRMGKSLPHPILNLSLKNNFGGEGGKETISKNSLKPSQDL